MNILKINNLTVEIENKEILKNFNLEIKSGEIHAIMGPNGTGKSTLSQVIMGHPAYKITEGEIYFNDTCINNLTVDERANLGIFLGMQMPLEIEGVSNADFLRTALRSKEGNNFKLFDFIKDLDNEIEKLNMDKEMIHRSVNLGFSGGERKKNEILQMRLLKPKIVMLDEIDSGLDVDSLKKIGESVNEYFKLYNPALLLVTHYQRLLEYIKPDYVHILYDGNIKVSGTKELVSQIENLGYEKTLEKYANKIEEKDLSE
jgi:Fe-S cluster assembly ATP-binding protein